MLSVDLCLQLSFVRFLLPSYVLAKEIETIRNVRGLDHLFREFHTSINHELPDRGKHFEFEDFLRKHWIYTVADFVDARKDRLLANGIDV
ncbi:hypothetical protein R70211_07258 [Paraburkholderia domus]|uniref:Uncharacterized protein n=1 Tax=Paraburkholderia domus TaxID=2793075 RepID=A0A9N8N8E8_9BURK|nr:hypothetical protein R70211_07258 [Paraburkholderia domus]